jgi:hypothetical protein
MQQKPVQRCSETLQRKTSLPEQENSVADTSNYDHMGRKFRLPSDKFNA